jgi:hypothetical protein
MPHDIDIISERVRSALPDVKIEQLRCTHAADDDGVWFFRRDGKKEELQFESSSHDFPFLIETSTSEDRRTVHTLEEAVEAVRSFFIQAK